ncbi:Cyclin-U1-1 [Turnera subulata]|uniref:Cyclin n=1 Tax=Turnera subulata TaxID=218843 RepID=A0A9Q0J8L9_9ROSI|nr:Cyclin-U1-1 [Turnera subulata]
MLSGDASDSINIQQPETSQSDLTTPRVLIILSSVLEKLVARNDRLAEGTNQQADGKGSGLARLGKHLNVFHGVRPPTIGILKYLERLYKYTSCSPSCFVVGYVYIDRLCHKHPDCPVISLNVHRLLVTSVLIASKVLDDVHYNNAFYARVGGVSNAELNRLELELLFHLDFGVTVSSRVFESYCLHLEKEVMLNSAIQKIERVSLSNTDDDVTEISVEDTLDSSPSQAAS